MENIVTTWIHQVRNVQHKSLAEGVRCMGRELNVKFVPNHVYDWKAGRRPLPPVVFDYMLGDVLVRLTNEGKKMSAANQAKHIFDCITLPRRTEKHEV